MKYLLLVLPVLPFLNYHVSAAIACGLVCLGLGKFAWGVSIDAHPAARAVLTTFAAGFLPAAFYLITHFYHASEH